MFYSLGLKNAWRNRGRTALGIVSMAIAAMIFLSSSSLSKGYPSMAFFSARQLLGGDIILLPGKHALSQADMAGDYTWKYGKRSLDRPNPAMGFDTAPYSYGTIEGVPASGSGQVSKDRYEEVVNRLMEDSIVRAASIRRSLPFLHPYTTDGNNMYEYGFLDERDLDQDLSVWDMGTTVSYGSYLSPDDRGLTGVSVGGWRTLSIFSVAEIEIPRYSVEGLDYEDPIKPVLTIKGVSEFVEGGGIDAHTLANPAIFVSSSTFDALATTAGYPPESTYWGISVTLKDMATSENVAALFQREFPDFTVLTAPELSEAVFYGTSVSTGVPMDMRRVTEIIAFVTAALLSATNLTVLMLSRKSEIGILRALGATKGNIASMVLTESIGISLMGALIGGILTQPAVLWQLLSNKLGSDVVLREVGGGIGKAVLFAAAAAIVFGLLPIAKALRVTPAQVMRGE